MTGPALAPRASGESTFAQPNAADTPSVVSHGPSACRGAGSPTACQSSMPFASSQAFTQRVIQPLLIFLVCAFQAPGTRANARSRSADAVACPPPTPTCLPPPAPDLPVQYTLASQHPFVGCLRCGFYVVRLSASPARHWLPRPRTLLVAPRRHAGPPPRALRSYQSITRATVAHSRCFGHSGTLNDTLRWHNKALAQPAKNCGKRSSNALRGMRDARARPAALACGPPSVQRPCVEAQVLEVDAHASVQDMIHAAIHSYGAAATLREVRSGCGALAVGTFECWTCSTAQVRRLQRGCIA